MDNQEMIEELAHELCDCIWVGRWKDLSDHNREHCRRHAQRLFNLGWRKTESPL